MTPVSAFVHEAIAFLTTAPILLQGVAAAIAVFVLLFLVLFLGPGLWLFFRLFSTVRQLRRFKAKGGDDPTPIFASNKTLAHLWAEYRDTLHEQRAFDPATGTLASPVLRATVPAGVIFTTETLVDSRIRTEFFKHLPGLFTGVGIIGTFSGLIQGLEAFKVSENPSVVRSSLEVLMHGVYEAFTVSAAAIFFAMVTTFIEKFLVTSLYGQAEAITLELDSMFQSGAGEEYLARLVKASEDSADQSKVLKDALVKDLKDILSELTEQQIKSQAAGSQALAQQFAESLTTGLQAPLQRIAESFEKTTQGNSDAVSSLLTDVLSGFSQKLQELFGGQITGINQLQQQTIAALQATVAKLDAMASKIEAAGEKTSENMGQKFSEAITAMETRQRLMNEQMSTFVDQIKTLVAQSHGETSQKLQETLAQLGDATAQQISLIQAEAARAAEAQKGREDAIARQSQDMVRGLSTEIQHLSANQSERDERWITQTNEAIARLSGLTEALMTDVRTLLVDVRSAIDALRGVTTDAVSRMNSGAETLYLAADEFAKAGQGVAGVFTQAAGVSDKLVQAANTVSVSSTTLQTVVADYAATRDTLAAMLADLRGTVENAKHEATLTSDVLSRIEAATRGLGEAQRDVEDYMAGITEVLAKTQGEFAANLQNALSGSYNTFYDRLSAATGLLRQAIEELALAVEPATQRRA